MSQFMQKNTVARSSKVAAAIDRLLARGVFRTSDAEAEGITQSTLSRMVSTGEVIRIEHGLFHHPEAEIDYAELDLIVACVRFGPESLVGGMTALFRYQLINEAPPQIWMIVAPNIHARSSLYRCIRSNHNSKIGVDNFEFYRMANLERAIVEAFAYATKIGVVNAVTAARTALTTGQTTEAKLYEMADALDEKSALLKYWEVFAAP